MSNQQPVSGYSEILDYLYDKYYRNFADHSDVTSSYWREIGKHNVSKEGDTYRATGVRFGSYKQTSLGNHFKMIPVRVLVEYLLWQHHCPRYISRAGRDIAKRSGHVFSFDCAKQILALNSIIKALDQGDSLTEQGINTVCVIGDGYAFFSSLVRLVDPGIRVIPINLGRTLFFDVLFSQRCFPDLRPTLVKPGSHMSDSQLVFIEAEHYSILQDQNVDLFINSASMGEMDPEVVENYFMYMRSSRSSSCYFYCCNRLKKELPDGTLTEFMKYPWKSDDELLFDELCPWYQAAPSRKPPFWRPLGGPIQHRLAKLSRQAELAAKPQNT